MFFSMTLRIDKKLSFAVKAEFISCNEIYEMSKRQLISF